MFVIWHSGRQDVYLCYNNFPWVYLCYLGSNLPDKWNLTCYETVFLLTVYLPLSRLQTCWKVLPIATWQVDWLGLSPTNPKLAQPWRRGSASGWIACIGSTRCQRTPCKTLCRYKVYDPCSYIHEVKHVILDDSAQIGATLTQGFGEVGKQVAQWIEEYTIICDNNPHSQIGKKYAYNFCQHHHNWLQMYSTTSLTTIQHKAMSPEILEHWWKLLDDQFMKFGIKMLGAQLGQMVSNSMAGGHDSLEDTEVDQYKEGECGQQGGSNSILRLGYLA